MALEQVFRTRQGRALRSHLEGLLTLVSVPQQLPALPPKVFHSACGVPPKNKENYGVRRATFLSGNRREIHCLAFFQWHSQFLARGPVLPPLESEMLPLGTSLAVHWLGLCACPAGSMGLSSGRGITTPHASQHGQNK